VILLALAWGGSASGSTTSTTSPTQIPSWTVYHGDPAGSGVAASIASVDLSSPAWTSTNLDGQLYGEPLVSDERVYVATENDTVYALSASTGSVLWSTHLGTPVPSGSLPCGDISPTVGITGTPVIDQTRAELFVVADELVNGLPAHQLVGLSTATGKTELNQNVDPAGSTSAALLQRTGLTLNAGHVVFGYGGNFGDCSTYHGWVMSVPEAGGTPAAFEVDSAAGDSQGAVWMGGAAPVVDSDGNIWVTAGNGSVTSSSRGYDDSDSVLELSPSLTLEHYFAPSSWPSDNARDLDFSTGVALLADGQVVAASKSRTVFLLNGSSLGGIGGQQAQLADACGTVIDGGLAVEGTTVYLPCLSGPIAVQTTDSPAGLRLLWSSSVGGGPPIVVGGLVWTIGSNGVLYALNPASGAVQNHVTIGAPANHFPTPSVGAGLLLAPSAQRVVAFRAASSTPAPAPTTTTTSGPTTTMPSTGAPAAQAGGTSPWIIGAAIVGAIVVLGVLTWLIGRRRGRGP
jgi:polyvinyl alcohol dehydrogenase (cytochrome)